MPAFLGSQAGGEMILEDTWQSLCSNKVQKRYRLFAMVILQIIIFFLFKLCFLKYSVFPALPLFYPLIIWFGELGSHLSL